jgi:hypothetical protein
MVMVGCGSGQRTKSEPVTGPSETSSVASESDSTSSSCSTSADALPGTIALFEEDVPIDRFSPWEAETAAYLEVYEAGAGDSSYKLELRRKADAEETVDAFFAYDQGLDDPSNQTSLRNFTYPWSLCAGANSSPSFVTGDGGAPPLFFVVHDGKHGIIAEGRYYQSAAAPQE